jgi:hypothetical protein
VAWLPLSETIAPTLIGLPVAGGPIGVEAWVQAARIELSVTKMPGRTSERRTTGDYVLPARWRKGGQHIDCLIARPAGSATSGGL